MRLLVCGGRDYNDWFFLRKELDRLHAKCRVSCIISGAARGADTLAANWARLNGVELLEFPADWGKHGKSAGFIRNRQMLTEGKPDGVVAFPGGAGTRDMMMAAREAGLKVWQPAVLLG